MSERTLGRPVAVDLVLAAIGAFDVWGNRDVPLAVPSAGSGIAGLRQRARLLGGTVTAHALSDGGWAARLQLPRT